jgi:hypothetical protein
VDIVGHIGSPELEERLTATLAHALDALEEHA